MKVVTCIAPVNIAVIKYWGKRDEKLILPLNDSISGTLSTDQMCAKTTVAISPNFKEDQFWLNGKEEKIDDNQRLVACIREIRSRARTGNNSLTEEEISWKVRICSENNFPTAAGLASSAAGYACLVYTLAQLYKIEGDITSIARQGSGSACRSIYGGFVQWLSGLQSDGSDSIAKQIVPANHWEEMRVLILVVSDTKKKVASTGGMQRSVQTSELLKYRVEKCLPERIAKMDKAIMEKDFATFAEITMKDSNQFHGVCLDTYPPCIYMNDISHAIANFVHTLNDKCSAKYGRPIAAYTFDAGPNACIYCLEENTSLIASYVQAFFPSSKPDSEFFTGLPVEINKPSCSYPANGTDAIQYVIHTKLGEGPQVLPESAHLLDPEGRPFKSNLEN